MKFTVRNVKSLPKNAAQSEPISFASNYPSFQYRMQAMAYANGVLDMLDLICGMDCHVIDMVHEDKVVETLGPRCGQDQWSL